MTFTDLRHPRTVALRLPAWCCELAIVGEAESPIYPAELCDAVLTAFVFADDSPGDYPACVLCGNNQAAVDALVSGSPGSRLGTVLVPLFGGLPCVVTPRGGSSTLIPKRMRTMARPVCALTVPEQTILGT